MVSVGGHFLAFAKGAKKCEYHRAVVLTLVGYDFPIPIGLEMMKKGEDEVKCALRLLKRIVEKLGVRFFDIAICDALYCTPDFFDECKKLGVIPGAVLKENQEKIDWAWLSVNPAAIELLKANPEKINYDG